MQMQQAGQQQMAMSAQQMQTGVSDVANQVAGGMQKMQEDRKRQREKVEGVQLQEDLLEFQQKLSTETAAEGTRIGTLMKQAQEATSMEINNWREKGTEMKSNQTAVKDQFGKMVASGMFRRIPNGYKMMDDIWKALKNSEAYVDDHTDPAYISKAVNLMHQAERDITAGRDPMDLAALYDKPKTTELAGITETGTPMADPDGAVRFADSLRNGYPAEGIYSVAKDDPRVTNTKLVTPTAMARLLVDNATYTSLVSDESRQKFVQGRMKQLDDEARLFGPMSDNYEKVSNMMFGRANAAVRQGVTKFASNPDNKKFANTPKAVVENILTEMFPDTPGMAAFAQGIRDRTIELDTPAEFASVMTMEAAAAAIEKRVIGALTSMQAGVGTDQKGQAASVVSQMAEQWASSTTPDQINQMLGAGSVDKGGSLTGVGLVRAQSHIQGLLEQAASYAGELRDAANSQGAVQGYVQQHGDTARLRDVYLWMHNAKTAEDKERAQKLLVGQLEGQADQMSLSDLQGWEPTVNEKAQASRTILDSTLEFVQAINPDQLPRVAALLAGGQVDLTDGRIAMLNSARQSAEERSSYLQLVKEQMKDRKEMAAQIKEARAAGVPIDPRVQLGETRKRQQNRMTLADKLRAIDEGQVGLGDIFGAGVSDLGQRTRRGYAKIGAGIGQAGSWVGRNLSKGVTILGGEE
jgi:hypothetical protein